MLSATTLLVCLVGFSLVCAWLVAPRLIAAPVVGLALAAASVAGVLPVVVGMAAGVVGLVVPPAVWARRLTHLHTTARRLRGRRLLVVAGHVSAGDEVWPVVDRDGHVPADDTYVQVVLVLADRLVVAPVPSGTDPAVAP